MRAERKTRAAFLLWVFWLGGCTAADIGSEGDDGPRVVESSPAEGDLGVPRNPEIRVRVDRALRPNTVEPATVFFQSGTVRARPSVEFDPVDRLILGRLRDGVLLEPDVVYRLVLDGVRDLSDRPLSEPFEVVFETGSEIVDPSEPLLAGWAEANSVFSRGCLGQGCHGADGPALGLDLSSPEGVERTAMGVRSRQLVAGGLSSEGGRGSIGLAGLPIIDRVAGQGRPGTSYLLYKVIGDEHIVGDPMPPVAPLGTEEQRVLSRWIAAGAPTD